MEVTNKNTLTSWFRRGAKPLASQFAAWINSYWHKEEKIPVSSIEKLSEILGNKIDRTEIENITSKLLLERRLTFRVEASTVDLFIDEAMTIYKVAVVNVSGLSMAIGENETPIAIGQDVAVEIPAGSIAIFNVTGQLTDAVKFLYIYAKVN